ncbi:hypothetical protein ACN6MY_03565 [Peribacillus sp. B-H-3]|uniref:hypothetical protein n=1 Tax=Peribacillus sp. B-H-3 TaxID=3400420 RepID=UPI003B0178FD
MNFQQQLHSELRKEVNEKRCFHTCLSRIEESIMNKDFKEAKLTACDLLNSIRELEKIEVKRKNRKDLNRMVQGLTSLGVRAQLISRGGK